MPTSSISDTSPEIERRQVESWRRMTPAQKAALISGLTGATSAMTVGGSIASSFAGEPRSTVDIDMVAAVEERHVDALVSSLSAEFYVDADALRRANQIPAGRTRAGISPSGSSSASRSSSGGA